MKKEKWTLTKVAQLLQQPQHRLIYLCEKEVIVPDHSDAKGRGSSRRFSARNIFEFSVALTLSEFHFPAVVSANFLYAIRSFESNVKKSIKGFNLPYGLMKDHSPEIIGTVTNGSLLYFAVGFTGKPKTIYGGVDINETSRSKNIAFTKCDSRQTADPSIRPSSEPSRSNLARFEINLTQIAQNLVLN